MKQKYAETSNVNLNIPMTEEEWNVVDFIVFESETAIIYPFSVKFNDLTMELIKCIVKLCNGYTDDTETIYMACENILGINPEIYIDDNKNTILRRKIMSLKKYLEDNKIDQIEDDQEFVEAEYNAVQIYCETCGYRITNADLNVIKGRGLENSFINWKETFIKDLWEDFGNVPMNPETEEIEQPWKHFLPGTHREEIWRWFEESFVISIADDLMGL